MRNIFKLLTAALFVVSCQDSALVNNRQAAGQRPTSDGTLGGPNGAGNFFTCENEESAKKQPILQNLGGYARPLCSLLSESSAQIAIFQTSDLACEDCVDKIKSIEADISKLTDDSKKKLIYSVTFGKDTVLSDSKKLQERSGSRAIWLKDHLAMLERFLAEQKTSWLDHPLVFVGTKSIAILDRSEYDSIEDLIHVAKKSFDVDLKLLDGEIAKEFSWDGLNNQSSSLWSVRSL